MAYGFRLSQSLPQHRNSVPLLVALPPKPDPVSMLVSGSLTGGHNGQEEEVSGSVRATLVSHISWIASGTEHFLQGPNQLSDIEQHHPWT